LPAEEGRHYAHADRRDVMRRPVPTAVVHFTHVNHLASIVEHGLIADSTARAEGLLEVEVGNVGIKEARHRRIVPIAPYGVVADYVPFYFAPRSPMMFAIEQGTVPTYAGGCDDLVYLVTTAERLLESGSPVLFTDRNAVLAVASFVPTLGEADDLIDWPLMQERYWRSTEDYPDRRERRMAECLVHNQVLWDAFSRVVTRNRRGAALAQSTFDSLAIDTPVTVRSDWYF
jgi:hypothetical protein